MSPEIEEIRDRIERARSESMTVGTVSIDPIVLSIENDDSEVGGGPYTVVPGALHCSCPDQLYRHVPLCKHLLYVLTEDTFGSEEIENRVDEIRSSYETERERLEEALSNVREQQRVMELVEDELPQTGSQSDTEEAEELPEIEDLLVEEVEENPERHDVDGVEDDEPEDEFGDSVDSRSESQRTGEDRRSSTNCHDSDVADKSSVAEGEDDEFERMVEDLS